MHYLFECFTRHGHISEGLVGDLMWGFAQVNNPIQKPLPYELTYKGLLQLKMGGYIKFQAKDNSSADLSADKAESAWVRYQPNLLELVYE